MSISVKNPTGKEKAIRIAGGHAIIKSGKSEKIDVVLTADEKTKYEAAGLVFSIEQKNPEKSGK